MNTEQLNIEGKRSGSGFVAHRGTLVNALSRALAERLMLMDVTIGRKGLLGYLKALSGSNIVKVVPSTISHQDGVAGASDSASGTQANGERGIKVVCGSNTSHLADLEWIGDRTPLSVCEVRVSPSNTIKPNMGSTELSEALNRVIPFTAKEESRPVLNCIDFSAGEGKLTLVSADGFRLAVATLPFDGEGEGNALINREDLRGIANALRRAKRVRLSLEGNGTKNLILDTDLIRYKLTGADGSFPDYQKLIPAEFSTTVSFDTNEAIRALSGLKVLAGGKSYPVDLAIGNGKIVMSNPDDKGQAEINADVQGEVRVRVEGSYLTQALKACGGMVELKLANAYSAMVFVTDGYRHVVMPMQTGESAEQMKRDSEAREAEAKSSGEQAEPTSGEESAVVAEAERIAEEAEKTAGQESGEPVEEEPKPKRRRKVKELATV